MTNEERLSLKKDYLYEIDTPVDRSVSLMEGFEKDGLNEIDAHMWCLVILEIKTIEDWNMTKDDLENTKWIITGDCDDIEIIKELGHKDNFPEYFL